LNWGHGLIKGSKSKRYRNKKEKTIKIREAIKKILKVTKKETNIDLRGSLFSGGAPALI